MPSRTAPPRRDFAVRRLPRTMPPMHTDLPSSVKQLGPASSHVSLRFQRTHNRLSMTCPVMFAAVPFIGEGTIQSLSQTGCAIACDRAVLKGSYITARLFLPDGIRSLTVDLAAVRWIGKQCFGIEFLRLPAADQTRLEQFLERSQQCNELA
jgi:hypothetical protein